MIERSVSIFFFVFILTIKDLDAFYTPVLITDPNANYYNWRDGEQVQKQDSAIAFTRYNTVGVIRQDVSNSYNVCKEQNGQFSDPKYCDKYYDCWEGRPVSSGQCSHGLMFNEQTSSCDYPSMVNCNGREVSQESKVNLDEGCEQPYGTFANPRNCDRYTVCHAGRASYYKCDEGLAYDKELGVCASPTDSCLQHTYPVPEGSDYPELPIDPDNIRPVPPQGPSAGEDSVAFPIIPGIPQAKCPTMSSGFVPVARDCQAVVVCINGRGYLLNCPDGSYFHASEARCKTAKSDTCEQTTYPLFDFKQFGHNSGKFGYIRWNYPLLPLDTLF